jgi:hypothetical protein
MGFVWRDEAGASDWGFDPEITYRPTSFLTVSGGVHFEKLNEDTQWVENVTGLATTHYVFGRIRQTTVGLTTRVNYTITPNLTVQVYAQPFVSADYSEFKELVRPRAQPFADQFQPYSVRRRAADFNAVVPHDERAALGIQVRVSGLCRVAAGAGRRGLVRALPLPAGLRLHVRHRSHQRVPREVLLLAQPVAPKATLI